MSKNHLDTMLSSAVSIRQYERMKSEKNVDAIADLIYERFHERYIQPFDGNPNKHGFSMMAVSCFMIEALHSFKRGWSDTEDKGKRVFQCFFADSVYLFEFSKYTDFYGDIRCGILHQAETKNGWKIRRRGPLLDKNQRAINATKFLNGLHNELKNYVNQLKKESFESCLCGNAVCKLDCICKNCAVK